MLSIYTHTSSDYIVINATDDIKENFNFANIFFIIENNKFFYY